MPTIAIENPVIIEDTAPQGHAEAVAKVFREAGFDVQVEASLSRRSAGLLPWIVNVGVEDTVQGFFLALGAAGFNAFVKNIWNARAGAGSGEGVLDLADEDATHLHLHSTLPDEALDALSELDWESLRGGYLVWKADRREWVDHDRRD